jgi:hypothetical protein
MYDSQLFLGLPVSHSFQRELDQLPASLHEVFIQNKSSSYLQQVEYEGVRYLGKYLGSSIELVELDSSQNHIYSLLKKLIPHFPYEQNPLLLFAL